MSLQDQIATPMTRDDAAQWMQQYEAMIDPVGLFRPLGASHAAGYLVGSDTLLVSFEMVRDVQAQSEYAHPAGFEIVRREGWSHLCVLTAGDSGFIQPQIKAWFDYLAEDGFFGDFRQVLFFGAGRICGYAAAVYSAAAPGAKLLLVQPQARMQAPDMPFGPSCLEKASDVCVIVDPAVERDCANADLFEEAGARIFALHSSAAVLKPGLQEMNILAPLLVALAEDRLTPSHFGRLMRARRNYGQYLRGLLAKLEKADRPYLDALLCRNVTARMPAPRFARRLATLEDMARAGKVTLPQT